MTETQKRIQELKKALPATKEKLMAVVSLFAISVTMMASATYAWVTLSRNPELGGVNTTVSANGNLEIALSDYDGKAPDPSGISDSFSAQGQTTHGANTSWGNLINLSSGYGLENLVLRPATLNTQSSTLLSGVKYGEDGRVEGTATDFGFTTWGVKDATLNTMGFIVPDTSKDLYKDGMYGVRAISSVGFPQGKGALQQKLDSADALYQEAYNAYAAVMSNQTYINVIQSIVQSYLDANISNFLSGGSEINVTFSKDDIVALCGILEDFYSNAVCKYGEMLAYMANMQQEFKTSNFEKYTMSTLIAASSSELSSKGVNLSNSLSTFKSVATTTYQDMIKMQEYKKNAVDSNAEVTWTDLEPIINNLINISTVKVNGKTAAQITGSGAKAALSFLSSLDKSNVPIVIENGTLRQFEILTGNRMSVTISFKILGSTYKGKMRTSLTDNDSAKYYLDRNKTEALSGSAVNKGPMVAQDTYGMVLDLWFRTNNPGTDGAPSILALDGLPMLTTTEKQREVVLVGETESRPVYAYQRPSDTVIEGVRLTEEVQVYKDENGDYRNILSRSKVYVAEVQTITGEDEEGNEVSYEMVVDTDTPLADKDVSPKMETVTTVNGFASSNRVWKDGELALNAGEISSTQGSGSCYVFYADSPEAAASAKELLSHMKLAFLDANGGLLAEAKMDVDHIFSQSGKYTVPLVIESSDYTATNANGEKVYGVTTLEQNVATRISVVVYLDGKELENNMVMSNESIRGSLNLQFTTTEDLRSMKDSTLSMQAISLRASIERTDFEYTGSAHTPKLSATVEGLTPNSVQAVFQRRVNASQGTQTTPVVLSPLSGDNWEGTCSFTKPGTYVLSSLLIDGVEYALPQDQWITVNVSGFAVGSVSFCDTADQSNLALSTSNSVSRDVAVTFTADLAMQPSTVGARFEYKVSADATEVKYFSTELTRDDGGAWRGTMEFTSSGVYTLKYLVLDGEYDELPEGMQKTFTAYLGLRTRVYLRREGGLSFLYTAGETETVTIQAEIITDNDAALMGRENVVLKYGKRGSSLVENGLSADLTWDGAYYSGTFEVNKIGVFQFAYLQAGNDRLTNAVSAPTVSCLPQDPPSLLSGDIAISNKGSSAGASTMFLNNSSDGYYMVRLKEASGIESIEVVFTDPLGNTVSKKLEGDALYENMKNEGEETYVYVPIPAMASGSRNGAWTVTDIRLGGVYSQGYYYGANRDTAGWAGESYSVADNRLPYTFAVYDTFDIKTDGSKVLGKNDSGDIVAEFMSAQSVSGYGVTIALTPIVQDKALNLPDGLEIGNVVLTLTHVDKSSNKTDSTGTNYGGYTISGNSNAHPNGVQKFVMEKSANGKWVVDHALTGNMGADNVWGTADDTWPDRNAAADLYLAGEYTCTISFDIVNDQGVVIKTLEKAQNDMFAVYSKTPSVYISDISLDDQGAYAVDTNTEGSVSDTFTSEEIKSGCLSDYKYTGHLPDAHLFAADHDYISRIASNKLTAWIYFKCNHTSTSKTYDAGTRNGISSGPESRKIVGHTYKYDNGNGVPRADLTLDGLGQASGAKLTFTRSGNGAMVMVTQYTQKSSGSYKGDLDTYGTDSYVWTSGGSAVCSRFIGVMENGVGDKNSDVKTVAGTITANQLVLTHNGMEYIVAIPTITINNPY